MFFKKYKANNFEKTEQFKDSMIVIEEPTIYTKIIAKLKQKINKQILLNRQGLRKQVYV